MKRNIVIFLKKSKKKARQEELTKPLIENPKNKVLKQTSSCCSSCCYSSKQTSYVAIVVKNVKPSKFMFKIYSQNKT